MDLSIEQAFEKALETHKNGKSQDAEALYRAILKVQPKHPDANHNLGVLSVFANKPEVALLLFKTALDVDPKQKQFWISYINTLIIQKQFDKAINFIEQGKYFGLAEENFVALEEQLSKFLLPKISESASTSKSPKYTKELKKLSIQKIINNKSLSKFDKFNHAKNPFQEELLILNDHYQKSQYELAENLARKIILKYPDHQFSWKVLGSVYNKTGRLMDSLIANQKAVALSPHDAAAYNNLGNTFNELGRIEEAEASFRKSTELMPSYAEAHYNLAVTLQAQDKFEQAIASYIKAIMLKSDLVEAHCNLSFTLKELGRLEFALVALNRSLKIRNTFEAKNIFIDLTKRISVQNWDHSIVQLVIDALLEPWGRPSDLILFASKLLRCNKDFEQLLLHSKDSTSQGGVLNFV